jgi:hypothetical protein
MLSAAKHLQFARMTTKTGAYRRPGGFLKIERIPEE